MPETAQEYQDYGCRSHRSRCVAASGALHRPTHCSLRDGSPPALVYSTSLHVSVASCDIQLWQDAGQDFSAGGASTGDEFVIPFSKTLENTFCARRQPEFRQEVGYIPGTES